MTVLIGLLTMLVCAFISARLMLYRRNPDARYRPGVSLGAWVLVVCTGGQALWILIKGTSAFAANPWQLGILLVIAIALLKHRGNLAGLFSQ